MSSLRQQRCFHHGFREAVAKCPSCEHFYCRECITEHDDRMICASCLREQLGPGRAPRPKSRLLLGVVQAISGFIIIWVAFYFVGQVLLETPTDVHEATLWEEDWWDSP